MRQKNTAPARIAANESQNIPNIPEYKGNHFFGYGVQKVTVPDPGKRLCKVFSEGVLTMKQASFLTKIDRASICPFVRDKRDGGTIYNCGRVIDPLTGHRATLWTMDRTRAVNFYKVVTRELWRDLPPDCAAKIFDVMDAYLEHKDLGLYITSATDDSIRVPWLKIQNVIDCKMAEK